ncbi:MAG: acetyltransferase [Alphaproteobacteria bacterium]|nr:MAG: acetyltransferase [Alphaproteobacteria bacterium]
MSEDVILIGAGGHAKVVIELFQAMGRRVAFCVGGAADIADHCLDVPVLAGDEHLARLFAKGYRHAFVAIGSNVMRRRMADEARKIGFILVSAVSPRAVLSPSCRLGTGVAVMAGVVVNAESVIEDLVILNTGASVDHDCRIGVTAHIAPQCALAGNVQVGESTFLGVGCKVIPGVRIGAGTVIGAGSVVIRDIPDGVTAMGVPARVANGATDKKGP